MDLEFRRYPHANPVKKKKCLAPQNFHVLQDSPRLLQMGREWVWKGERGVTDDFGKIEFSAVRIGREWVAYNNCGKF